jgi:hypothetical protein
VTDTENFAFEAVGGDAFFMFIDLV